jgi:hypothetical protein
MSHDEKAAAFDRLLSALVHRWATGEWSWWCPCPTGGAPHDTREEAVVELLHWADDLQTFKSRTGAA